ncbi:TasA family protein [Actinomycetes bacterium NPDC127524]
MKNIKKALIATSMAGAVLVSAGYGTYSWFTSETQASGTIQDGTLSVNDGKSITTKLFDEKNLAPSEYVSGNFITLDNTGSLDQVLKLTYSASVDKAPAAPFKIYYVALKYKEKPSGDVLKDWKTEWEKGFFKGNHNPAPSQARALAAAPALPALPAGVEAVTGELSSADVQSMAAAVSKKAAGDGSKQYSIGDNDFFTLKSDQYIDIAFDVKLDENAGNEYQAATYSATLKAEAKQTDDGAKYESEIKK